VKSNNQTREKSVLLIEDDAAYRTLVLSILRKAGINCIMCINTDQAMKKLTQTKFDLIISDYLLPGPNAIEFIKWARSNNIGTPVVVITNFPSEELQNKIKAINHTHLISKSTFNVLTLPKVIEEMIIS
jgi:DNA-binding NtrC family response regulator